MKGFLGVLGMCVLLACSTSDKTVPPGGYADLWIHGGRIVTLEAERPEVEALAIRADRIVAAGSRSELEPWVGPSTVRLELPEGSLVTPGWMDSHAHFLGIGEARTILRLNHASTWTEILEQVVKEAERLPQGSWIRGRGWHQEKWREVPSDAVEGFPTHLELSRRVPHHPVLLTHASGHAVLVNAAALALTGIDRNTPDPPGGQILRFPDGSPTGLLREEAASLVERAYSRWLEQQPREARAARFEKLVNLAQEEVLSKGLTTVHDAGSSYETVSELKRLAEEQRLRVRLWVMLQGSLDEHRQGLAAARRVDPAGYLSVRAIKILYDGALGSRGAWLLEPYSDLPGHVGLRTFDPEELRAIGELALAHDIQLATHAIGDRANREVLDLYAAILSKDPKGKQRRWRIEHAQHLHPVDIPRFGKLGVIASVQAIHCTSDAPFVVDRLGLERAREGAYAWRALVDSGAVLANGTDAPVEDIDPIPSFYAAVTRRLPDGTAFFPEQRLTREEALRSYTLNAAYAAFEEDFKGSIRPGKLADLTIFDRDLLSIPEDEILQTRVLATIVGGKIRYQGDLLSSKKTH